MADLSAVPTPNPTKGLQDNYQRLMAIQDPAMLASEAEAVAKAAGGVSVKNLTKMQVTMRKIRTEPRPLERLQSYLTNFILSGCGMSVGKYEGENRRPV